MKAPVIDETKLPEVMEIIEEAVSLMDEKDCENDEAAKTDLEGLQNKLREITGNHLIIIRNFRGYYGSASLETVARDALMSPPEKEYLTDEQIKEIVLNILNHDEPEMDWWLKFLKLNTGLTNLTDYIFHPDLVGLDSNSSLEQISNKIIMDRK